MSAPLAVLNIPQYAVINLSSSGDTVVVPATNGFRIVVTAYYVPANNTDQTLTFKSGGSNVAITGPMLVGPSANVSGLAPPNNEDGHFSTAVGDPLVANVITAGSVNLGGHLTYKLQSGTTV